MPRRPDHECPQCRTLMVPVAAELIGGLHCIPYEECRACGYTRATNKPKQSKRELLKALRKKP